MVAVKSPCLSGGSVHTDMNMSSAADGTKLSICKPEGNCCTPQNITASEHCLCRKQLTFVTNMVLFFMKGFEGNCTYTSLRYKPTCTPVCSIKKKKKKRLKMLYNGDNDSNHTGKATYEDMRSHLVLSRLLYRIGIEPLLAAPVTATILPRPSLENSKGSHGETLFAIQWSWSG